MQRDLDQPTNTLPTLDTLPSAEILAQVPKPWPTCQLGEDDPELGLDGSANLPEGVCDRAHDVIEQTALNLIALINQEGCVLLENRGDEQINTYSGGCGETFTEDVTKTPSANDEEWACTLTDEDMTDTNANEEPHGIASSECTVPGTGVTVKASEPLPLPDNY